MVLILSTVKYHQWFLVHNMQKIKMPVNKSLIPKVAAVHRQF